MFRVNCTKTRSKALALAKKVPAKRVAAFACATSSALSTPTHRAKGAGGFTKATTEISSYQTPR